MGNFFLTLKVVRGIVLKTDIAYASIVFGMRILLVVAYWLESYFMICHFKSEMSNRCMLFISKISIILPDIFTKFALK